MLTENDVVSAVADWLSNNGYRVVKQLTTTDRGIDIDAVHKKSKRRLVVEAKGGTSSKEATSRFGKPFDRGQVRVHVSRAFYSAAELQQRLAAEDAQVAMAFPDDPVHRQVIEAIASALRTLEVRVFLVSADGTVAEL